MLSLDIVIKVLIYYKKIGILNLGIKTLLFEMTGHQASQFTIEKNNVKDIIIVIEQSLKNNKLIILVPEG